MAKCKNCRHWSTKEGSNLGKCNWRPSIAIPSSWKYYIPGTVFMVGDKEHDCPTFGTQSRYGVIREMFAEGKGYFRMDISVHDYEVRSGKNEFFLPYPEDMVITESSISISPGDTKLILQGYMMRDKGNLEEILKEYRVILA